MFPRPLLLAALPWAALGVQAWWLCAVQSLGVLITLRRSQTDSLVVPLTLLVLALLGALSALPDLRSAALTFAVTAPVALALGVGTTGLLHGSRWALALLAGVLLLGPTWLGLLGLLLGALALGGPDQAAGAARLGRLPQGTAVLRPRPTWGWVVGAALLLLLFAALPRPDALHRNLSPIDVVQVVNAPGQSPAARSTSRQPRPPSTARPRSERDPTLETILDAANLPLLGMALLCLALLRRGWGRAGSRPSLWSLLLGATLLAALGLFVLGLLLQPPTPQRVVGQVIRPAQTQPQSPASASQPPPTPLPPRLPAWLIWTVASLGFVMLAGAAWFVLTLQEPKDDAELAAPPPAGPAQGGPDTPLGRVRAAYAATLQLLSQHGLTRAESETPDELLARAAVRWPEAAPSLSNLTAAYRPVRYGAAPDEQGAEAAERGAAQLRALLTAPASHPTQGPS